MPANRPFPRREFLQYTAGSALAAGVLGSIARAGGPASAPKKILILGGTGFLGPATIDAAKARGHTLTLFNRGRTEKRKGGLYPELDKVYGNRDPDRRADESKGQDGKWTAEHPDDATVAHGLDALKGRSWDVVIDNSGYYPRHVKASAELLAPNAKQYIFISSVSAYAKNETPNADEDAELGTIADPTVETMGAQFENYGPLKVLCENAVREAFKDRATIVRPGYIVGPGDPTDRYTYWPVRFDQGGEVLVPGDASDPVQVIDVRDLGEWLITLAESGTGGVFNAVGPEKPATTGAIVESCKKATKTEVKATMVPWEYLDKQFKPGEGLAILIPPKGETIGFHTRSNARAIKAGLRSRTLDDTAAATLAWFKSLPEDRRAKLARGLTGEREAEVLAQWHKDQGK